MSDDASKFAKVREIAKHLNPTLDPAIGSLRGLVMALIDTLDPSGVEPPRPPQPAINPAVLQWTGANAVMESPVDAAKRLGLPVIPTIRGMSPGLPGYVPGGAQTTPAPPSSPPDEAVK
jgi:hypothetical protein